jgi:cell division protein FtsB
MQTFKNFRKESRDGNWGRNADVNSTLSADEINCGSMLRIADALEVIAKDRVAMESEIKRLKEQKVYLENRRDELLAENKNLSRSRNTYKRLYEKMKDENNSLRSELPTSNK